MTANETIKTRAKEKGVKLWEIADALKISDANFSRILRHELPDSKQIFVLQLIDEIAEENEGAIQ